MTALQIRDFLSGEFTPLPLADVMAVLKAREAAGRDQADEEVVRHPERSEGSAFRAQLRDPSLRSG